MKARIKMSCAATLIVLMATALAGAPSAMAESTALCNFEPGALDIEYLVGGGFDVVELPESCESPDLVSHVHEVSTSKAVLLSSPNVECDVLFLGDVKSLSLLGAPLVIEGGFTYSNCGSGCSVNEENSPQTINVLKEGHELAKVTSGTGSGTGLMSVNCFGIMCKYVSSGLVGHRLGALLSSHTNGDVTLSGQTIAHESGVFCPSSAKLDIQTTPLAEPIYVAR